MLERISVLKKEIDRLRKLAHQCDADIGRKFLELADEMQAVVGEMERMEAAKAAKQD